MGFSGVPSGTEASCQCRRCRRCRCDPWVRKMPWRAWQPAPGFLLGIPMDRGAWWATAHRVIESDMTERLNTHAQTSWLPFQHCFSFDTHLCLPWSAVVHLQGSLLWQQAVLGLRHLGSIVVACGLHCPSASAVLVLSPRIEPHDPGTARRSLNHRTTSGVL